MTNCQVCDVDKKNDEFSIKSSVGSKYVYYKKTCKICTLEIKNKNKKDRVFNKFTEEYKLLIRNNIGL